MTRDHKLHEAFRELGCLPRDPDALYGDFVVAEFGVALTFCGACRHPVSDIGECECAQTDLRINAEGGAS